MGLSMGAKLEREQLRGLVEPHWRRLYNFMFRLTLDRDRAERYLSEIWDRSIEALEVAVAERLPETSLASANTIAKMLSGALVHHVIHSETIASVAGRPLEDGVDPTRWQYLDELVELILRGVNGPSR